MNVALELANLSSSSPALRGSSSKLTAVLAMLTPKQRVIIPCVAGQFFEAVVEVEPVEEPVVDVIIPCVAGQFFEGVTQESLRLLVAPESSSPALRGSSSKTLESLSARLVAEGVIIPCVAGQFFEGTSALSAEGYAVHVIIPCVAGQFFEVDDIAAINGVLSASSSPALRGSSSKSEGVLP